MKSNKVHRLTLSITALAIAGGFAVAQERAGTTVKVQPDAFQALGAVGAALSENDEIYRDARVYTKQYGSMDIQLEDGTDLAVLPNSSLVIDEYVYAGPGSAGSLAISLTRGAMRMVSGKMSKPSYAIRTPIATIGVRGTTFTLNATDEKTDVWVQDGTVVANAGGQDFVLDAPAFASCDGGGCTTGDAPPVPTGFPLGRPAGSDTDSGFDEGDDGFSGSSGGGE